MLKTHKGEILTILACLVGSVFPVLAIFTFRELTPIFSAAFSTFVAGCFFAVLLTVRKSWGNLWRCKVWKHIILYSFYIGVAFHALLYLGMQNSNAGNTAILMLMEVFFAFLILGCIRGREPLVRSHIAGSILMISGALIVLLPSISAWQKGDLLVVLATLFGPIGNPHGQDARREVSTEGILFSRSLISSVTLFILGWCLEPIPEMVSVTNSAWILVCNGVFVFALSKLLWMEGINLIPITVATSLLGISPAITMVVAYLVLGEKVSLYQMLALPLIAGGVLLVSKKENLSGTFQE